MPAQIHNLHVLAYAAGFTSWLYKSASTVEEVNSPGFFNAMSDMMAVGDVITAVCVDGTAMRYVASVKSDAVTIEKMKSDGGRSRIQVTQKRKGQESIVETWRSVKLEPKSRKAA